MMTVCTENHTQIINENAGLIVAKELVHIVTIQL
jgi:hypothetical protein